MGDFAAYLAHPEYVLLMAAVSMVITGVQRALPGLMQSQYWLRLLPMIPIAACVAGVWMPGLVGGDAVDKTMLGTVLGAFCGQAHKIVRQTLFGDDKRIRNHIPRL